MVGTHQRIEGEPKAKRKRIRAIWTLCGRRSECEPNDRFAVRFARSRSDRSDRSQRMVFCRFAAPQKQFFCVCIYLFEF
jgi:hypothetical protein